MQNLTELEALQTAATLEAKKKEIIPTPAEERAAVLELRRLAYIELHKNSFHLLS